MRRVTRFLLGTAVGLGALAGYLAFVGVDTVLERATAVTGTAIVLVTVLVAAEAAADGIGVWASIRPLGDGLSPRQSVQFALAGDFFDTLSPAGPVSSEPIMARFFAVTTETSYSDALGARSLAKYVKSGTQLLVSTTLAAVLLLDSPDASVVVTTLGAAVGLVAALGVALFVARSPVSTVLVAVLAPVVRVVSGLVLAEPYDRETVSDAVERFWDRILRFRERPRLVALIGIGGVTEQLLTAGALWAALVGTGATPPYLVIVALIPLPQAASAVPIPGSLGAYDILLAGGLTIVTGIASAETAAAVLVVRTIGLPLRLAAGGVSLAFLRGWRPT